VLPAIILFAKAPIPGRVKTRLAAAIGEEAAARLHYGFVAQMLENLSILQDFAHIELHTDEPTTAWDAWPYPRRLQACGPLQLKLFHALSTALRAGHPSALVAGSDAPSLPVAYLRDLVESATDVSFGPCEDGGYYAIAARRTEERMFEGVQWSTRETLEQNERACRLCGLSVWRGRSWFDIDEPEDLGRMSL
jgi:rSAM/selenodomain-associated transferase 1